MCKEPPKGLLTASAGVSRILYPVGPQARRSTTIYLGPALLQRALAAYLGLTDGQPIPCLALLLVGFTEPSRSPGTLVVSYTTVSPLPESRLRPDMEPRFRQRVRRACNRRSTLCCTFHRVAPPGCYPAPCPVESGLSSTGFPAAAVSCTRRSEYCLGSVTTSPRPLRVPSPTEHGPRLRLRRCLLVPPVSRPPRGP